MTCSFQHRTGTQGGPISKHAGCGEAGEMKAGTSCGEKRFLVLASTPSIDFISFLGRSYHDEEVDMMLLTAQYTSDYTV